MKKSLYFSLFFLSTLLFSCSTTYYVVRHGEKSSTPPKDPLLSEEGLKRAQKLKTELAAKGIKKIYATNYQRTKMIVQPLADALGIQVEVYNPSDQLPFVEKLKKSGENTVVAGHSNTIKQIVNGLAEKEVLSKDLDESEYDNIYTIKRKRSGKPVVKAGKY